MSLVNGLGVYLYRAAIFYEQLGDFKKSSLFFEEALNQFQFGEEQLKVSSLYHIACMKWLNREDNTQETNQILKIQKNHKMANWFKSNGTKNIRSFVKSKVLIIGENKSITGLPVDTLYWLGLKQAMTEESFYGFKFKKEDDWFRENLFEWNVLYENKFINGGIYQLIDSLINNYGLDEINTISQDQQYPMLLVKQSCYKSKILLNVKNSHLDSLIQASSTLKLDRITYKVRKNKWKINQKYLMSLENKHQTRRAFVIGNGPSLQIQDLDFLKNEITFAANKIYLAFDQTQWRPTYYGIEDHLVYQNNKEAISKLEGFPQFYSSLFFSSPNEEKNKWSLPLQHYLFYPEEPNFAQSFEKGVCWGATILYTFIQMAYLMGIQELYLIGVDFYFKEPKLKKNEEMYIAKGEQNHFHPKYRSEGEVWHRPCLHFQEKAFQKALRVFNESGRIIKNASRKSHLDVFDRVKFESLF